MNWGQQDERDSIAAIHAALDGGVNWVDTAPFYGWGRAEEVVGNALRSRDDVLVFTKCGTIRREDGDDYMDLRPETVRADLEQSLRRLQRDHVDHAVPVEEAPEAILELTPRKRPRSLRSADSRRAKRAPRAGKRSEAERGKRRQCRAPLASGFLTDGFDIDALEEGDFRRTHPFAQRADLADLRREIGGTVGAIRFVLGHPAVTGAIVGVRNEREAREIVRSTP